MQQKLPKILYFIIALIIMIGSILVINNQDSATSNGQLTIEILAIDDTVISSKSVNFFKGDTLKQIIEDNFDDVLFESSSFGPYLTGIEGYVTPSDFSTYISIYIDGVYSTVGIGQIDIRDNITITLKVETNQ